MKYDLVQMLAPLVIPDKSQSLMLWKVISPASIVLCLQTVQNIVYPAVACVGNCTSFCIPVICTRSRRYNTFLLSHITLQLQNWLTVSLRVEIFKINVGGEI